MAEELPAGVRKVPAPAVHWMIQVSGYQWDGYVFEDDPSDLAKFMRWLATEPFGQGVQLRMQLWRSGPQ